MFRFKLPPLGPVRVLPPNTTKKDILYTISKIKKGQSNNKTWNDICNMNDDSELPRLKTIASTYNIKNKNTRKEICELLYDQNVTKAYKNRNLCSNKSSIYGSNTSSIPEDFLFVIRSGKIIYCFNILDIYAYISDGNNTNPFDKSTLLPVNKIKTQYKKVQKKIISDQNGFVKYSEFINESTQAKILSDLFKDLHLAITGERFLRWSDKQYNGLLENLYKDKTFKISDNDYNNAKRLSGVSKKAAMVNIIAKIVYNKQ